MQQYSKLNHLFKLLTNLMKTVNTHMLMHETQDLAIHGMLHLSEQHNVFNHVFDLISGHDHEYEVEHDHSRDEIRFKMIKSTSTSLQTLTDVDHFNESHRDEFIHLILTQNSLHVEEHHVIRNETKKMKLNKKRIKYRRTMIKNKEYLHNFIQYLSKMRNLKTLINGFHSLLSPDFTWLCSSASYKSIRSIHLENLDEDDCVLRLIPECCPALQDLTIDGCKNFTSDGLCMTLKNLKELQSLCLNCINPSFRWRFFIKVPHVFLKNIQYLSIKSDTIINNANECFKFIIKNQNIQFLLSFCQNYHSCINSNEGA